MLRYIHHLQSKDLSLVHGMIPLGSCTMKLNATTTMIPVTYPGFSNLHPFAPVEQAQGYHTLIKVSDLINSVGFFFGSTEFRHWRAIFARLPGFTLVPCNPTAGLLENTLDYRLFVRTTRLGASLIGMFALSRLARMERTRLSVIFSLTFVAIPIR